MLSLEIQTERKRPWQLIGFNVMEPDGQRLGTIEDVVVNKSTDQVEEVVIGRKGLTGAAESFMRLALSKLEFSKENAAYIAMGPRRRSKGLEAH